MAFTENYYDRRGKAIDRLAFYRLHANMAYKRIASDVLTDGTWLSTVWLGRDHAFPDDTQPVIFETMVFKSQDNLEDLDMQRYVTEEQAQAGHRALVAKYQKLLEPMEGRT